MSDDDDLVFPEPERREVGVVVPRAELTRPRASDATLAAVLEVVRKYEFGYGLMPPMLALKKALGLGGT